MHHQPIFLSYLCGHPRIPRQTKENSLESGVFCAKTQPPLTRKNRGILSYNPLKFKSLFSMLKKSEYEIW